MMPGIVHLRSNRCVLDIAEKTTVLRNGFQENNRFDDGVFGIGKEPYTATRPVPCAEIDQIVCNSPRIRLSDGRFLAYRERGVPKNKSNYRVIIVHGFGSPKEMDFMASKVDKQENCEHPFSRISSKILILVIRIQKRSLNSESSDIEELADRLQLGSKFYVVGVSVGCYPVWGCLRQIPNSVHDRYVPIFGNKDLEVMKNTPGFILLSQNKLSEPSMFDTLFRDFMVAFGKWDFDPMDLCDPYPQKESLVYIWQGCEDKFVPF